MIHNGRKYRECRCKECHKLLCYEQVYVGRLLIKCKCGAMNEIFYKTRKLKAVVSQEKDDFLISNFILKGGVAN